MRQEFLYNTLSLFRQQNTSGAFEVRAGAALGARPAAVIVIVAAVVLLVVGDLDRV